MFLDPVQPKPKIGHPRYKFGMNWVHEYFPKWIRRRPSMHRSQNTTEVRTWRYLFVLDRPKFTYFCIFHRITKLRRKDNVIQWLFRHLRRCIAQNPPMTCLPCAGNDLCVSKHTISVPYDAVISWSSTTSDVADLSKSTMGLSNRGWTGFDIFVCCLAMALVMLGHSAHHSIVLAALLTRLYNFSRHNYSALPKTYWTGAKGTWVVVERNKWDITN